MKLEFAKRALRDIERKGRKWLEECDEKDLFERELEDAFKRIKNGPQAGQYYTMHRDRRVLRVLMKKTENHVYYRQDAPGLVRVLCVWGARRKSGPKLG